MKTINSLTGIAVVLTLGGLPARAELIDFEEPTYPDADPCCQGLDGMDGWTADSGWILFNGNSVLNSSQVMWNNGAANEFATRDFTTPLTSGTLTYELRPDDPGAGESHWLLPQDTSGAWALQLLAHRKTKVNTNHEFELRLTGGGTVGTSPDVAAINFGTQEAWYEIRIDFDLADTTAGPNGTFDLQITRIDGTPQVVWDFDGQHIANPVLNIGKFTDNGSTASTGHATLIDNINLIPEPSSLVLVLLGTLVAGHVRRHAHAG